MSDYFYPKGVEIVSNPIREYLQIQVSPLYHHSIFCFKPYKGVSSNLELLSLLIHLQARFKPYKGVSSNPCGNSKPILVSKFQTL